MQVINQQVRGLLKKYTYLCSWFIIHDGDNSISVEEYEKVLNEIGRLETELIKEGVSNTAIERMIDLVKEHSLADKPLADLTEQEQLRLFKAIFGEEVHWEEGA